MMNIKQLVPFLGLSFILFSCSESPKEKVNDDLEIPSTKKTVIAPVFNEDSAYLYIKNQVAFGPRVPNTNAHIKCGNYFMDFFKAKKVSVIDQRFQAKAYNGVFLDGRNVIASINPEASKRILIAAHWDTRPWADQDKNEKVKNTPIDGANDGASGAGVIMELARTIHSSGSLPKIGVDFILFDVEDYGKSAKEDSYCLGSQYWAGHKHKENYVAFYGILLDMVGGKNAQFCKEAFSLEYAPSIVQSVWNAAGSIGYGAYFIDSEVGAITDDHYYVNKLGQIPMIDIIEYHPNSGFGDFWHTQQDNMDAIDKKTLKAVGQTLLQVIYNQE